MKTPRTGARGTVHLIVFLTLVVCISFAAWRTSSEGQKVFRDQFRRQLDALDQLKINQLAGWQIERKGDAVVAMSSASMMPDLEAALSNAAGVRPRIAQWMDSIRGSYMYTSVELLDGNGNVRMVSGRSLASPQFYARLLAETKGEGQAGFRYFSKGGNVLQSMYAACAPLRSQDGKVIGALVLTVDPWANLFPDILKWPSPTRTGRLYLVQREDTAVRVIGINFQNSGIKADERLIDLSQHASPFVKAVALQEGPLEGLDDQGHRVSGFVRHLPTDPDRVLAASAVPPAVMVALMDESEAFASLRQNQLLLVVASGLLIVLCGAGVGWIWRQHVLQSYRQQLAAEHQRRALIGHYDYLTRFANDAVFLVDRGGTVVQVNERASDYYGYSQEEMIGMNVSHFRAPGTQEDYEKARQQIEKQRHAVFESMAIRKDGVVFPVELSVRVMEVEGTEYRQSIIRDITERRRAQAQIDRLNRLYAVLSRCGQAIVKAHDESALFREVVNAAVDSGRFCIAAIRTVDPEGRFAPAAEAGPAAGYLAVIGSLANDLTLPGMPERSSRQPGTFVCNDLWREPATWMQGSEAIEAARKFNVRSLMQAPLWRGDQLAGELRLYSSEPDFFNDEEVGLATEVAESLCFALESIEGKRKQQNVEAELRTNRERLELVLEATEDAYWDWDLESGAVQQSPRYDAMLGYASGEVTRGYQEWLSLMHPEDAGRVSRELSVFVSSGKDNYSSEFRMRRKSGEYVWVSCRAKVVRRSGSGSPLRMVGTLTDVTDRKKLEEQFRQSQKLESVGRLAGGIAHDFNNLLTVINGYSRLLITSFPANDSRVRQMDEIRKAGERAAELTRQLLTFSRKNVSEPRLLNLNAVAAESETILRRLTPDNVEFTAFFGATQDEVVIDPSHLQQVLMNLVVNACDAMPKGGKLTIRTSNADAVRGSAEEGEESHLGAGMWVLLEVMDTGVGMNEDTLRHIFEPFFTTKDVGKGTGLGLSTVYGIVRQCGGIVRVVSEPGTGSTFRVYFPVASQGILAARTAQTGSVKALTGTETVLVVEDQDVVREYTENALRAYGYSVMSARSSEDALEVAKQRNGPIDLLLTDVIMPSTNGRTLARELRKTRPETRVLFMSGYVDDVLNSAGELEPDAEFLQKPFSPEALAEKVRRTLSKSTVSRTVLVVEDEAAVRGIFTEFLGKKHNLLLACDGREALEILRSGSRPDLVITDLIMPNQEGLDLIREIRKTHPETRIIAMSGAFSGRFLKTAELLGADATLVKPIHPEVLDQMIEDVLIRARRA